MSFSNPLRPIRTSKVWLNLASLALLFCAVVFFALTGCGGGGGGGTSAPVKPTGAVTGRLVKTAAGVYFLAYGGLPAGDTPVVASTAAVAGADPVKTGNDGVFKIADLATGYHLLTVTPPSGAPITVDLTILNGVTIEVGDPPISRSAAVNAVKSSLGSALAGTGVWAFQQPVPAGCHLKPALWANVTAGPVLDTTVTQWVVYVDLAPNARYGHDVVYYFVDPTTGAVSSTTSDSWPAINNVGYYDPATRLASKDLVQAPPVSGVAPLATVSRAHPRATLTGHTYAMVLVGAPEMDRDATTADNLLKAAPIPPLAAVDKYLSYEESPGSGNSVVPGFVSRFHSMATRSKPGDTFVLYISSHGVVNVDPVTGASLGSRGLIHNPGPKDPPSYFDYFVALYNKDAEPPKLQYDLLDPTRLDFSQVGACNILVIVDTCHSDMWRTLMTAKLAKLSGKHIALMDACTADQLSWSDSNGAGIFSTAMVSAYTQLTTQSDFDLDSAAAFTSGATKAATNVQTLRGVIQTAGLYQRTVAADECCPCGDQGVIIK